MLYYKTITKKEHDDWVVMVHGAGCSMEVWYRQVADFSRHFNILLVDLAGHGETGYCSEAFGEDFNFYKAADQVLEVVDYLKIRSCHFMGLSMGTIIVRIIAEEKPQRVKSMILAGAVTEVGIKLKWIIRLTKIFKRVVPYSFIKSCFGRIVNPRGKYKTSMNVFIGTINKLSFVSFITWLKLVDGLNFFVKNLFSKNTPIPTLYIMGDEDYLFLPQVRNTVRHYGGYASLVVVPEAGHICNVDNGKIFNNEVLLFLRSI